MRSSIIAAGDPAVRTDGGRVAMRVGLPVVALAALFSLATSGVVAPAAAQAATQQAAPSYVVDAAWPGDLPNDWILGQVSGIAVDARDHVWVLHRPRTLTEREAGAVQDPPIADCCVPAPAVLEIDPAGNVVNAWGGPDHHPHWPPSEHGIFVDADDNVWIGSNGRGSAVVLKFTRDGRHLMTLGTPGDPGTGSNDPAHLNQPADMYVEGGEVFVADGYGNRRVVVLDAATGEYQRHWGAYGERPDDVERQPYDPDAPLVRHFRSPVHGLEITRDGLLYVADRVNNRIQVFRKDGAFVREGRVAPRTLAMGSVWDIAASHDPDQSFLFVADGTNMKVWVVRRSDLEVVGSFGRGGRQAGQFEWLHNLDVDSRGRIYTSEVNTGKRIQRFLPAGPGGAAPRGME